MPLLVDCLCMIFRRNFFKASQLQINKTASPKPHLPEDRLIFGKSFTDHMLTVKWNQSSGWSHPQIAPFQKLSLSPATSVFHYATEVIKFFKLFIDLLVFRRIKSIQG